VGDFRIRKLGKVDDLEIWLVDGERIRNEVDIDFTCGGHHEVYPWYIPDREIWLDNALSPLDRTATLLHELVEHEVMKHRGWNYDRGHDLASKIEAPFRVRLAKRPPAVTSVESARRAFDSWREQFLAS